MVAGAQAGRRVRPQVRRAARLPRRLARVRAERDVRARRVRQRRAPGRADGPARPGDRRPPG